MKTSCALMLLLVLFGLPACNRHKKRKVVRETIKTEKHIKQMALSGVNIPLDGHTVAMNDSDEDLESFFGDDELDAPTEQNGSYDDNNYDNNDELLSSAPETETDVELPRSEENSEFTWVDAARDNNLEVVYFNFDSATVRQDQKETVAYDAAQVKELLAQARSKGEQPKIAIEGHACSSAGSKRYNLAISENRAKAVADVFVAHGVPQENIKIVARGQDVPVIVDGKKVAGSRNEQWQNRRVAVHVINA